MRLRTNPYRFFIAVYLVLLFVILLIVKSFTPLEHWMSVLLAMNIAAFILTGYDKSIAGGKDERVPEQVLFGIALFGGSLGLMVGMNFFRHKTRKSSFQFVVGVIVAIQVLLIKVLKF